MILSVSRRTDIPNFYSEWFMNRIKEGYLYVRNPMNYHQVSKIIITPEIVDCIVFWTKNPEPMLERLDQLKDYKYYFQFTLTGYGKDIEPMLLHKEKKIIPLFQKLSSMIGKERVIWRYDPIIITERYTKEYHLRAFQKIAESLSGYCERVVISFVDMYAKIKKNMNAIQMQMQEEEQIMELAKELAKIANDNGLEIVACAESLDLSEAGIGHGSCIDKKLIERITGYKIKAQKDKSQRVECGCIESVETGAYNTCLNCCKYCYANYNMERVRNNASQYNADSPILCDRLEIDDRITERRVKSLKN